MTFLANPPLVIDTCIFSNFAWIDSVNLLEDYCKPEKAILLGEVEEELKRHNFVYSRVRPYIETRFKRVNLDLRAPEFIEYIRISKHLGMGEAAVLAYARFKKGTVLSDNLRDIKKYCKKYKVLLVGTAGIFYNLYEREILSYKCASNLWTSLIDSGRYKAPVGTFEEVRSYFEDNIGKELF